MKKFGLIGKSLGHSFSQQFFGKYFSENEIDAQYENIELSSIQTFETVKDQFDGFNVTIPYKEEIIEFLDELSPEAREINAVNVVQRKDGKWIGHNSDAFGFHQSIKPFLTNKHERAIIFGTGGASKAVAHVLKSIGVNVIYISNSKVGEKYFRYEDVNEHMLNACKLLVNCTPVGTYPNIEDVLDIPFEYLTEDHLVVDLIYNPAKTVFLKLAEEQGATILNGHTMLVQQALKAYQIWNG